MWKNYIVTHSAAEAECAGSTTNTGSDSKIFIGVRADGNLRKPAKLFCLTTPDVGGQKSLAAFDR
jgi:hypothetical protein